MHLKNTRFRDLLMQIAQISEQIGIGLFVETFEDFELLTTRQFSESVRNLLDDCFLETEFC